MSLFVNCSCGSRFEVEETFAGQTVSCPECQSSVRVPALTRRPLRTSAYALASVLLGVTLAFTVVGTIVAVILGCVGLVSIARNRDRVTGAGFAVFGIVWGLIFTGVTLMALTRGELFGLDQLRQQIMAGEVDMTGPMEVIREKDGFAITRPSSRWGVARESLLQRLNPNGSLLLANVLKDSYLSVSAQVTGPIGMAHWRDTVVKGFNETPPDKVFGNGPNNPRIRQFKVREVHALAPVDGAESEEIILDGREMGQARTYVVRIIKDDRNRKVYFIYAWTQSRRFSEVHHDLRKAMDSFRILKKK
jgi:hypothetical protein